MAAVEVQIDIAATPEEVWRVITDVTNMHEWVTIHRKLGDHDEPLGKGKHIEQTLCLRGVNFKVKWTVVEWKEPKRLVWEGRGPARSKAKTVYDLAEHDGGTRFSYSNEFKAPMGPLGAVAAKTLVGGIPQREANASLRQLKKLLERG